MPCAHARALHVTNGTVHYRSYPIPSVIHLQNNEVLPFKEEALMEPKVLCEEEPCSPGAPDEAGDCLAYGHDNCGYMPGL